MLQLAPLLFAALLAQVQVEIVRQPHPGGIGVCSPNGAWATGVWYADPLGSVLALRWSAGSGLERLHGTTWSGIAIADHGGTVLTMTKKPTGLQAAALWTQDGLQVLPDLGATSGWAASYGTALSCDGRFAAGVAQKPAGGTGLSFPQAVRWSSDGALVELLPPQGAYSSASDLSDDGRIVVGSVSPIGGPYYGPASIQTTSSALWTDGAFELLDEGGEAFGTSSDGTFVVGASQGKPYRWDRERGMQFLDVLRPRTTPWFTFSQALQVSDDGGTVLCEEVLLFQQNYLPIRRYLWLAGAGAVSIHDLLFALDVDELLGHDQLRLVSMSSDGRVLTGTALELGPPEGSLFWRVTLPQAAATYGSVQPAARTR